MPITEKTARLKQRCRWKHNTAGEWLDPNIKAGIERMRYLTESYKQTEGEQEIIRRAKGLANILNKITIYIQEDELIVGDHEGNPNWISIHTELSYAATIDLINSDVIAEEFVEEAEEIAEYWNKRGLQRKCEKYFDQNTLLANYMFALVEPPSFVNVFLNMCPNYESVLEDGLLKRIEVIEEKLQQAINEFRAYPWDAPKKLPLIDKIDLYEAMIIANKAVIAWARRYSRLAKIMAEHFETDAKRKEELLQISEICWRTPAEPCKGMWDAMQAKWLVYIVVQSLERAAAGFSHKEDRLLWPYYKTSVIDKTFQPMTREQAQELIECERLKISEHGVAKSRGIRYYLPGTNDLHILTIGGLDENGEDGCNEVTDIILDAAHSIRTIEPSIGFRWHPKINLETKKRVFKCIASGLGFPSIKHEELNVAQLKKYFGVSEKDARSWALILCMSPGVSGRRNTQKSRSEGGGGTILTAKCIELLLNDGFDPSYSKMQVGPHTGDPRKFKSFDEALNAFKEHYKYAVWLSMHGRDISKEFEARFVECPFMSSIDDACVEEGKGAMRLTNIPNPWFNTCSDIDACDSLVALKKLVFDEKKYTIEQLTEALAANWEGYEEMRLDFYNAPKWGNDDSYADEIAVKVHNIMFEAAQEQTGFAGVPPLPLAQSVALFAVLGPRVGALPSGRKAGEVLGDGGISPYMGVDKKGPTAVLKSISKVDALKFKGLQLNQRLSHSLMNSDKGFGLWLAYMNTWYDLNIDHVQFNVVRNEDLLAAQKEPEKYEDVIVRVAGYSARFVSLTTFTQDAIIARTEHKLGA